MQPPRLPLDEARLLPRYRPRAELIQNQADVLQAELERAVDEGVDTTAPRWKTPVGDDFQRLRGLPAVAKGVGSVAPGTDPLRALLAKERRRR